MTKFKPKRELIPTPSILKDPARMQLGNPPTRQLIFTGTEGNTYEGWKQEVDRTTPKGWGKTFFEEQAVSSDAPAAAPPSRRIKSYALPIEFCPYCPEDKQSPAGVDRAPGLFVFKQAYPGLDIKPGDGASHYACVPCMEAAFFPARPGGLILPPKVLKNNRDNYHALVEENIIEYIKAEKQRGVTGSILGSESRRERFKDDDEDRS